MVNLETSAGSELRHRQPPQIVPPNGMIGLISKPNIAIRAGDDTHAHPEEGELELSHEIPVSSRYGHRLAAATS